MQNNFELVVKWLDIEDLLHLEQTCKYFKNYKELWNWYFYYLPKPLYFRAPTQG